jgi:hypothetical protein
MRSLMKRDLDASHGLQFNQTSTWISRECNESAVSIACNNTVQSLSRFWGLLTEEHSHSYPSEIRAAKSKFEATLVVFASEPCLTPSDGRAKFATLDLLENLFPEDDCRLVALRGALVRELSRFFDMGVAPSFVPSEGATCSCHGEAPLT